MKIFGIGTDIVNIKRMKKLLNINKNSFKKRIFSKNEIIYCEKKKNPSSPPYPMIQVLYCKNFECSILSNFPDQ